MALGDAEGGVAVWEWRTRHFRILPHSRSPIRKLRFAPGKNNMKLLVLHMEGLDIWDVKDSERLGQWRNSPFKDYLNVLDAEWCASDRPLLACSDGSFRVFDLSLQQCNSAISDYEGEPIPCPLLMPRSAFQVSRTDLILHAGHDGRCAFDRLLRRDSSWTLEKNATTSTKTKSSAISSIAHRLAVIALPSNALWPPSAAEITYKPSSGRWLTTT